MSIAKIFLGGKIGEKKSMKIISKNSNFLLGYVRNFSALLVVNNKNYIDPECNDWFGMVSLFYGISTLFRLFNAKAIVLEEQ